jgi:hypothetical protein
MFEKFFIFMIVYSGIFSILELKYNNNYKKALKKNNNWKNIKILLLLLLHNIVYVAIYFTLPYILYYHNLVQLKHLYVYLLLLIYVPIHWYSNDNKCLLTVKQNELLGIDKDTGFRDFISILANINIETSEINSLNKRDRLYYAYLLIATIVTVGLIYLKS